MGENVPRSVFFQFVFRNCRPESLIARTAEKELGDFFANMIKKSGFTPVARYIKIYPDNLGNEGMGGYTAEITLEESSANIYTWPEDGDIEGDIYYCNWRRDNKDKFESLYKSLLEFFGPEDIESVPVPVYRRVHLK